MDDLFMLAAVTLDLCAVVFVERQHTDLADDLVEALRQIGDLAGIVDSAAGKLLKALEKLIAVARAAVLAGDRAVVVIGNAVDSRVGALQCFTHRLVDQARVCGDQRFTERLGLLAVREDHDHVLGVRIAVLFEIGCGVADGIDHCCAAGAVAHIVQFTDDRAAALVLVNRRQADDRLESAVPDAVVCLVVLAVGIAEHGNLVAFERNGACETGGAGARIKQCIL